jgi:CRISPR-associated protein Cmr1
LALLGSSFVGWEETLDAAGRSFQDFRVRRPPDYENVKQALGTGRAPANAPERTAFGLPLAFRYTSLGRDAGEAEFVPRRDGPERKRHASLLRIRVTRLGDRLHPLFVRMAGALPGTEPAADMLRRRKGERPERAELEPATTDLLDTFMNELSRG